MYQQSAVLLWALYWVLYGVTGGDLPFVLVAVSGILVGTYWSVASNLLIEPTQDVTDGAGFTVGHQQMFGSWLVYQFAKLIGNKDHDINDNHMQGWMSIFNDNVVSNVLIMSAFIGAIMVIVGPEAFDINYNKYWFATFIFEKVAFFAVYITIIQLGVRMFVTELTASFQGISEKILPGSVPAVDCAVTFGFSPNAPTYGFIFGFVGQMIAIGTLIAIKSPIVIIAGFISLFFDNGTLAVYANKAGGRRAAMIVPFLSGLIQVFGSAIALTYLVDSPGVIGWMGMFDWATLWMGTVVLTDLIGILFPIALIVGLMVVPQIQYAKSNKENYFTTMKY
jgi:PTS system ascorbate-specific IIC component